MMTDNRDFAALSQPVAPSMNNEVIPQTDTLQAVAGTLDFAALGDGKLQLVMEHRSSVNQEIDWARYSERPAKLVIRLRCYCWKFGCSNKPTQMMQKAAMVMMMLSGKTRMKCSRVPGLCNLLKYMRKRLIKFESLNLMLHTWSAALTILRRLRWGR